MAGFRNEKDAAPIENRLTYLASKGGWFVPASAILDRAQAIYRLKLDYSETFLKISNASGERIDGLTVISNRGRSLRNGKKIWSPRRTGEIVLGTILPGETLVFTIN